MQILDLYNHDKKIILIFTLTDIVKSTYSRNYTQFSITQYDEIHEKTQRLNQMQYDIQ